MILFLTPSNVAFPSALATKGVPKRFLTLGRRILPAAWGGGLFWRTMFETPLTRYAITLSPFGIALFFKPEWAFPISLAPVPMLMLVLLVEGYVLSIPSPSARRALIDGAEADRVLDLLKTRADAVLTRMAAARDPGSGMVHLVIEQSELLRVPPLTYVSIQQDGAEPGLVDLTREDQAILAEALFDADLDERRLRLINVAQDEMVRVFSIDPASISAHVRLAALARAQPS